MDLSYNKLEQSIVNSRDVRKELGSGAADCSSAEECSQSLMQQLV